MTKQAITAEIVREHMAYDADTGLLTWRISRRGSLGKKASQEEGILRPDGYKCVKFFGLTCFAHRLAWLHVYGTWPEFEIDHINGDKSDNRIANLRDVPHAVNNRNRRRDGSANLSGYVGVSQAGGRWCARVVAFGKIHWLGTYDTPKIAHEAYLAGKKRLHEGCTI